MIGKGIRMSPRVFVFLLLPATLVVYFSKIILLGESIDIFMTNENYLNWIEALHDIPFEIASIPSIYTSSFIISAPEPIASYLTYLLCLAVPNLPLDYYLDIYNILYIVLIFMMLYRFELPGYLKFLLAIAVSFGYYEFTALHSTHRLKLALMLLMAALLLRERKPLLARNFTALAFMTHFSLFAILPFLQLLGKRVLKGVEPPSLRLILVWAAIFYSGIVLALLVGGGDLEYFDDMVKLHVGNKMSHAKLELSYLGYLIIAYIVVFYAANRTIDYFDKKYLMVSSIAYLGAILVVVGTSTLLYSLYVILMPILVAAYGKESVIGKRFIVAFLIPLAIYSLFKGATLAPWPLYVERPL